MIQGMLLMKVIVFSGRKDEQAIFEQENQVFKHQLTWVESRLTEKSVELAKGYEAVVVFVNDQLNESVIARLASFGVRIIALRCAGFNQVDLQAAKQYEIPVVRVPAYSPHAIAEHSVGLLLCLVRHLHKAYNRVRDGNFLLDGLLGFDLAGKTVGVVGMGSIGQVFAQIMQGFGCHVLAFDPKSELGCFDNGVECVSLEALLSCSDVISLHCPLTPTTYHMINQASIETMKKGVVLINTGRGGLLETDAVIEALKQKIISALGIDVYEEEANIFFQDLSNYIIQDDDLMRLTTFPNVLVTGHQGFFTQEAVSNIAQTTLSNLEAYDKANTLQNEVSLA